MARWLDRVPFNATIISKYSSDGTMVEFTADPQLSRVANRRRSFLSKNSFQGRIRVLEIGAFDNPTISSRDDLDIAFMDAYRHDELVRAHKTNPRRRLDRIVEVNYVVADLHISRHIHEKFDLIIANHVIEHIPDPIKWLDELGRIAAPQATLFLTIPDMRYCFDCLKQPSDLVDLYRAHTMGKTRPDQFDIARSIYYHAKVAPADFWKNTPIQITRARTDRFREAIELAAQKALKRQDVHCFQFTTETFREIMTELYLSKFSPWKLIEVSPVMEGDCEFYSSFRINGGENLNG